MKTHWVFLFALLLNFSGFSQDFANLGSLKMKSKKAYEKNEPLVLECATYLLSHPAKENEPHRLEATRFMMRWMEGTKDYSFALGPDFTTLTGGKPDLLNIYLASLVKVALESDSEIIDPAKINEQGKELYLDYCAVPENGVKPPSEVEKLLKKRNK